MRRSRRRLVATLLGIALVVVTTPLVVAADSVTGQLIRTLNRRLLYIAVPIALLVETILFYAVWRFRGEEAPEPTRENRELEITWTVATALVLLFVGTASFATLGHPFVASAATGGHGPGGEVRPGDAPPGATEVVVVAEQWAYTFRYPDAGVTSRDELVLPADRRLHVYVTSKDVLHSLHVPGLGLKQDIFPGQYRRLRTRILEPGEHRLYCTQFCGTDHANMVAPVRVLAPDAYDAWLERQPGANATAANGSANATTTSTSGEVER